MSFFVNTKLKPTFSIFPKEGVVSQLKNPYKLAAASNSWVNFHYPKSIETLKTYIFAPSLAGVFQRKWSHSKKTWWFSAWQVPPPAFPEFKFCILGITQTIFLLGEINVTFICWKTSQDSHHHLFDFPVPAPEGSPGTSSWGVGSWEFCLPYRIGKNPVGNHEGFSKKRGKTLVNIRIDSGYSLNFLSKGWTATAQLVVNDAILRNLIVFFCLKSHMVSFDGIVIWEETDFFCFRTLSPEP